MNLHEIRVFIAVVEAGSFVGASRALDAPPSTVSARIGALERRLGITLIQRTTRTLRVTEAGRAYFEECRAALQRIAAAEQRLADAEHLQSGTLRLTAAVDVAQHLLPPVIAGFRAEHPGIGVDLVVSDRMADMVADGIDLAIRPGPLRGANMVTRAFVKGPTGLFASTGYLQRRGAPETVADLASHDFIGFSRMPGAIEMQRDGKPVILRPESKTVCDDMVTIRHLVALDMGIGLLPGFLGTGLVRVLPELSHRVAGVWFAYPAQRYVPQRVRRFIDFATRATTRPA